MYFLPLDLVSYDNVHMVTRKILFLIPKGDTDTRGVGLLESLWTVVEAIVETCLRAKVSFHDVLHGKLQGEEWGNRYLI